MTETRDDCALIVERGPGWLFVRLVDPPPPATVDPTVRVRGGGVALADRVWELLRAHHAHRLVLECDGWADRSAGLTGAIAALTDRMRDGDCTIRLCGVPETVRVALAADQSLPSLPCFANRRDAVDGRLPDEQPHGG